MMNEKGNRTTFRFAALLLVLALSAPFAGAGDDNTGGAARGARTWADNCAHCHQMREPGEFSDAEWKVIVAHMRNRAGLTGQQARDVVAYMQAANDKAVAAREATEPGKPTQSGAQIYAETCTACHGADGTGALPGVPNFSEPGGVLARPEEVLVQSTIAGVERPGAPLAMPPKGGNPALSEADIREVIRYIRNKFRPK